MNATRRRVLWAVLATLSLVHVGCGDESPASPTPAWDTKSRMDLQNVLQALAEEASEPIFRLHFNSILQVIQAGDRGGLDDQSVEDLLTAFQGASTAHSPRLRESYLDRSRPLIVAWVSPTDGQVSFVWLTLPAHWDPSREYPLYVQLHGLWDVAQAPIPYLAYPYSHPGSSFAFEDGYLVSPWGRGNRWYRDTAETDIWEGLATIKRLVRVNPRRQYLCGHSMGGYGAWHIAHRSAGVWAALGVHAGALSYYMDEVTDSVASELRGLPTYFVVGTADGLFEVNQTAHGLLQRAGNPNLAFVTFAGGHDYRQVDVEAMYSWLRQFENAR